jgi:hypothetical protein
VDPDVQHHEKNPEFTENGKGFIRREPAEQRRAEENTRKQFTEN